MNRINEKIEEIEAYIQEPSEIMPLDFEEYVYNNEKKAACERYFEKIVEAIIDLAFLVIREERMQTPEEDKQAFDVLEQKQVISSNLSERLREAKGMRNIIAHEYGKIDDEIVFESIKDQLIPDVEEFIKQIKTFLNK